MSANAAHGLRMRCLQRSRSRCVRRYRLRPCLDLTSGSSVPGCPSNVACRLPCAGAGVLPSPWKYARSTIWSKGSGSKEGRDANRPHVPPRPTPSLGIWLGGGWLTGRALGGDRSVDAGDGTIRQGDGVSQIAIHRGENDRQLFVTKGRWQKHHLLPWSTASCDIVVVPALDLAKVFLIDRPTAFGRRHHCGGR